MKINLKIKKSQLDEIIIGLQNDKIVINQATITDRIYYHLFNDVFKKLLKKQVDKADDYTHKPIKITLNYPEAAALWNELNKVSTDNVYRANACRSIKWEIYQNLA